MIVEEAVLVDNVVGATVVEPDPGLPGPRPGPSGCSL